MRKWLIPVSALILILGACSPSQGDKTAASPTAALDADAARVTSLADEYFREYVVASPEQVAAMGLPGAANDRLSDNSMTGLQ